jgi:multiple sugar transport system permease protein
VVNENVPSPAVAGSSAAGRQRQPRGGGTTKGLNSAGWAFVSPAVILLLLFLAIPIVLAFWVSLTDWVPGRGSPFSSETEFIGAQNYQQILTEPGLTRTDFWTSIRNNFYYVLFVVPIQTVLALALATLVNQQFLRAKSFFRTAFYFPSVTSSVAITLIFLFLLSGTGPVNSILSVFGIQGPTWFADTRGVFHIIGEGLGLWTITEPPAILAEATVLGLSAWEWISGPTVQLSAIMILVIWTTSGTFMLVFLAALQDVPVEVEEAAKVDGANAWQRYRAVTLPHLRPAIILVVTLGIIGTWQVFDQVFIVSSGAPQRGLYTPAFLSYFYAFENNQWGVAAAMAFVLFAIIIVFTLLQRLLFRDRVAARERRAERRRRRSAGAVAGSLAYRGAR